MTGTVVGCVSPSPAPSLLLLFTLPRSLLRSPPDPAFLLSPTHTRSYLFTQESLKIQLAKARAAHAQLQSHLSPSDPSAAQVEHQLGLDGREKGFGGLEALDDKFASTRGDH